MFTDVDHRPVGLFGMNNMDISKDAATEQPQVSQAVRISNAFDGAAANENKSASAAGVTVSNSSKIDLSDRAAITGIALREGAEGIQLAKPPQGDLAMLGGQAAKMGLDVGKEAFKLGGEFISSMFSFADSNNNGVPDHLEGEQTFKVAQPQIQSLPSPGIGSPGMG